MPNINITYDGGKPGPSENEPPTQQDKPDYATAWRIMGDACRRRLAAEAKAKQKPTDSN